MWLNDEQRAYLNEIYAAAFKKYNAGASNDFDLVFNAQAKSAEAEQRIARIRERCDERVLKINTNAAKRGMLNSTVVLEALDNAQRRCNGEIAAIENKTYIESQKLALAFSRERATQQSRSIRDTLSMLKAQVAVSMDAQELIDNEIYAAYFTWLTRQSKSDALAYVLNDPLFFMNLGSTYYVRLVNEMQKRAGN